MLITGTAFVTDLPAPLKEPKDYAMVLMNINGFKFVNEFFGFESGNRLSQHIAMVLHTNVCHEERYYRDSADHFGMPLTYHSQEELIDRIRNIQRKLTSIP